MLALDTRCTWCPGCTACRSILEASVPVALYSATEAHRPAFHQFEEGTGDRIRNQRVNERTGDEVEYSDVVKGADVGSGNYVMLGQEELNSVARAAPGH